jgi:hypothetical protein
MRRCVLLLSLFLAVPATAHAGPACVVAGVAGDTISAHGAEACVPGYDGPYHCERGRDEIGWDNAYLYTLVCVPYV